MLLRLGGVVLLAILTGWFLDRLWLILALVLGALLAWHLYNLARLERWLRRGPPLHPPQGLGLWAVAFEHLYRMRRSEWRRKRRLATLLRQFRQATAALPDGAVVLNRQEHVLWFNAAAGRLLGLRSPQDVGNPLSNVLRHPALAAWLKQPSGKPLSITSPVSEEVRLSLQLVTFAPEQKLLLARDMTRMHRLEQVRQDFVANASHELRTPLTVIAGYLEAMEEDVDREWKAAVGEMRVQSRRMTSIVEDLLTLSRLDATTQPASQSVVDVPALIEAIKRDTEALSDGRHQLKMLTEPDLKLLGEAQDLRSAFSNLVTNAVRYTQDGGGITIRWYGDNGSALFTVQDNGPGIAAQHIPRLTERFYRISPSRSRGTGGTGLGLSIVKHVLALHQAELRIESEVGRGSTFTCIFPAERVARGAARAPMS